MRVDKDHTLRSNQEQPIPKQNCHIFSHGPYTFVPGSQWTDSAFRIRSGTGMKISQHSGTHYSCYLQSELTLGLWSQKNCLLLRYILYPYFLNSFLNIFFQCSINPFWPYVGPRLTVWFSCSAPMSEYVRHGFCRVCSPAVGTRSTLFLMSYRALANR